MQYETIRNCGEIGIEFSMEDSVGTRVTRRFLERLVKGIVRRSINYYKSTGDYVFSYGERQMHSVVCPSIAAITKAYLMEHSLARKPPGEDKYPGRVDYWVSYRNYSFLMELKHGYFAYKRTSNPRQDLLKKFNSAIDQLKSIRKDECEWIGGGDKGLFKIAFLTITFFSGSQSETKRDELKNEELKSHFDEMMKNSGLAKMTNLRALWILDKFEPVEYSNAVQIFPAVAIVGQVF